MLMGVMLRGIFISICMFRVKDSAEALHLATREMRKRGLGLDRWVKFMHVGA